VRPETLASSFAGLDQNRHGSRMVPAAAILRAAPAFFDKMWKPDDIVEVK